MSEPENDGFYWEPTRDDDLRQGDLMFNVPIALMPQHPRFVFGSGDEVVTQTYADYPTTHRPMRSSSRPGSASWA
jgi:hypothetical protein